ncbi:MAG: ABC transporter substrate-binding protein [Betaproteobacteria bacterium]|nr:ABC transporter substrate-binding protein [Betaproteobacteria bacterium]
MLRILALLASVSLGGSALAQKTIRIAPQSNLAVLDPFWTTATVTRTHGYMIYDTLFGTDLQNRVQPQMVENWSVSADRKTWTFVLRAGLEFHDGKPVTSEDVLASLARWSQRDNLGQRLAAATQRWDALDARRFRVVLKHPFGLMLEALGKPGAHVPFIVPRRVAETASDRQIEDTTGSGPYIFKRDEWRPGALAVYVKNPRYRPRAEAPSATAGGKRVFVDRVEWHILRDAQTQASALANGEIDLVEQPAHEHYASLRANPDVRVLDNRHGAQVLLRFNHLNPPFDDPRIRRAALVALSQEPFLQAQYGSRDLYRTCLSLYPCGTPYETNAGMQGLLQGDVKRARAMLREAGYPDTPVVILQPTDLATIARLPLVAAQQLRMAGFKVELAALDWQAVIARRQKKEAPAQGGWSIFITTFNGLDLINPVVNPAMNAACDRAWPGWPCDERLEALRAEFLLGGGEAERRRIAAAAQSRALEVGTHAALGEYLQPVAARKNVTGYLNAPVYLYWNLDKR